MATSAEILARLRAEKEAEWARNGAWQQTPTPTPQPIPASMGRIAAPQTNYGTNANRNLPAASPMATPTPAPTRNRQAPVTPTPTVQQAGQQYQKQRYDPLSSARSNAPQPLPQYQNAMASGAYANASPLDRLTMIEQAGKPTPPAQSLPAPASTPQPAQQSAYSLYMPMGWGTTQGATPTTAPTTRPVTQQPINQPATGPMVGPPAQGQATDWGRETGWTPQDMAPAAVKTYRDAILENGWTTHDPLLDYILRTGDERVLSHLRSQGWARPMLARYEQYISQPYQGA